jgi:hypothetical protein
VTRDQLELADHATLLERLRLTPISADAIARIGQIDVDRRG